MLRLQSMMPFKALSTTATSSLDVLVNDTDPDTSDTKTITTITQPPTGSGTLAISTDGKTVTYTPPSSTFTGKLQLHLHDARHRWINFNGNRYRNS